MLLVLLMPLLLSLPVGAQALHFSTDPCFCSARLAWRGPPQGLGRGGNDCGGCHACQKLDFSLRATGLCISVSLVRCATPPQDFNQQHMQANGGVGVYEPMDPALLPPMQLVLSRCPSDSGKVRR